MSVTEISASGQHLDLDLQDSNGKERLQIGTCPGVSEAEKQLSVLADVAVAPPCGKYGCCGYPDFSQVEKSIWLQLQFFLSKADCVLDCLIQGQKCVSRDSVVTAVQNFLYTCQPFFNHLEKLTRSIVSQSNPLPAESCTREIKKGANTLHTTVADFDRKQQLLDFSQQLCDKLEQMLLSCSSYNLLSLDEKEPQSVSQFCIGQSQLRHLRLTTFRYCVPTPYLSQVNTGLYKRMRWNVEKLNKDEEREAETDYYFLCYEDGFRAHREADDSRGYDDLKGIWSIGRWVQVDPDPNSDDINDWILCEVPLADYHRLLFLGEDEPSSCKATDSLMKLLLILETTD